MSRALVLFCLFLAGPAVAGSRPAWIDNPPQADRHFVYAVGEGQAKSRTEAEKKAVQDAVAQLARQVEVTVTGRTISTLSKDGAATFSEHRESVRTVLQGVEPVGEPYVRVMKKGIPPFRRRSFRVKVLMKLPRSAMESERQRAKTAWKRYRASLTALAKDLRRTLRRLRLTGSVAVGGFTEATTGRAYTMSTMLKKDLGDALVRAGIKLRAPSRARTIVTGSYRVHGGDIVVTARVRRTDTGHQVAVADTVIPQHAVEPAWLQISTPIEPFFEALEPARAKIKDRFGAVSIDSRPRGRVFLDGEARGLSPVDVRRVPVGLRSVLILADDYEPYSKKVRIIEGEKTPVSAKLKPKTGNLEIRSIPSGAKVLMKRRNKGKTPLKLRKLRIGSYDLTLRKRGYQDAQITMVVKHRETTVKNVRLKELPGSLFVVSEPPGARILLDGRFVGKATAPKFLKLTNVEAGKHEIVAVLPGRGTWQGTARVRARQTTTVHATVKDMTGALILKYRPPDAEVTVDGRRIDPDRSQPSGRLAGIAEGSSFAGMPGAEDDPLEALYRRVMGESLQTRRTLSLPLVAGNHTLALSADGYQPWEESLKIRPGKTRRIDIALDPRPPKSSWKTSDTMLATAMLTVPGLPLLTWSDDESMLVGGTLGLIFAIGEIALLANGRYKDAGGLHATGLLMGIAGVYVMGDPSPKTTRGSATQSPGVALAWRKRF